MMSQLEKQFQYTNYLISQEGNQTMKSAKLIEHNMRNIHKMWWRNSSQTLF